MKYEKGHTMEGNGEDKAVYTVDEVAEILRIGRNTVYGLVASGDIPHIKFGSTTRIPADELELWMRQSAEGKTHYTL